MTRTVRSGDGTDENKEDEEDIADGRGEPDLDHGDLRARGQASLFVDRQNGEGSARNAASSELGCRPVVATRMGAHRKGDGVSDESNGQEMSVQLAAAHCQGFPARLSHHPWTSSPPIAERPGASGHTRNAQPRLVSFRSEILIFALQLVAAVVVVLFQATDTDL